MIYSYCRVSTKSQQLDGNSLEDQMSKIKAIYPDAEFVIEAKSGAKDRPEFEKLLNKLQNGDLLIVTKLDRFCRSVKEGLQAIDKLMGNGVKIHILNMGLIDSSPIGRIVVTNLLAYAEFERAMILERTQSGKEIAKLNPNFREGRPKKFTPDRLDHALQLLSAGNSYNSVEKLTAISKSTLVRAMREKRSKNEAPECG